MKKVIVCGMVAGILVLMGAGLATAGSTWDPGIQQRERIQEHRIADGVASGRLTPWEARRLGAQQAHIRHMETRMKADGCLTPRERWRLQHELTVASGDIWRAKHNGYWR